MDWTNLDRLRPHDEVKFVIKDRADYEFARDVLRPPRPGDAGGRRPLLAGPRRDGPAPAVGVGAGRRACRCACRCSCTSTSGIRPRVASDAVVLLSGGLDSYTTAALARQQGFALHALTVRYGQRHAVEVDAARAVARALGVARHVEIAVDLSHVRRLVADERPPGAQGSRHRPRRDPLHLRARAQHRVPVAGARMGRGAGRPRHRHRRERARLLRLPRLPAGVHRRLRGAGVGGHGRRRGRRALTSFTRRSSR